LVSLARFGPQADKFELMSEYAGLDEGALLSRLEAIQVERAALAAEEVRVLAALDAADRSERSWSQDIVACVLKIATVTAQTKLKRARTLVEDLTDTLDQLAKGTFSARHAELIAEASWAVHPDLRPAFEARVLARAGSQTLGRLRQSIKRAAIALDPVTAEHRRRVAQTERGVFPVPLEDGLAELRLVHTADAVRAVYERVDAAARLLPATDPRSRDQQRADLLIDGLLTGLPLDHVPTAQGRRPTVQVIVPAGTLLGADDQPGWLAGYGPITAGHARAIASDPTGTWRRLLTDPDTGHLIDAGAHTYRPSQHLIDYLSARDGACSFPTCARPAHRCQIEHNRPFDDGGQTTKANGALACHRHNEIKKPGNPFRYQIHHDGTKTWTHLATGRQFVSEPPQRWTNPPPKQHQREDDHSDEIPF